MMLSILIPVYSIVMSSAMTFNVSAVNLGIAVKNAVTDEESDIQGGSSVKPLPIYLSDGQKGIDEFNEIVATEEIHSVMYLSDSMEVKVLPTIESGSTGSIFSGDEFIILGAVCDDSERLWFQIRSIKGSGSLEGYLPAEYVACVNQKYLSWKEKYLNDDLYSLQSLEGNVLDVDTFPVSYQKKLQQLKEQHPNWIFVKMNTGIEWQELISSQIGDRSLVHDTSPADWKNGSYGTGWSYATEDIIKYFIDPRNWLSEKDIFQFELLGYTQDYHTVEAVSTILANTFMAEGVLENGKSYAWNFVELGKSTKVSPFLMATRVRQEQGTKGTSALISGTYNGYEGYYNYYNIGASGKTEREIIVSGLEKAKEKGWNTRLKSLEGGAEFLGGSYINAGQDTLYLQKFDVDSRSNGVFWHQYMQNIQAPSTEAEKVFQAYKKSGLLQQAFIFRIPIYSSIPSAISPLPGEEPEKEEHDCGEWIIDKADCETPGKKSRYCQVCDNTETVILNPYGHRYEVTRVVEPTEQGSGYKEFTCNICNDTYVGEIPKIAKGHKHKYEVTLLRAPTDTMPGILSYTCYCKDSYREQIMP